MALKLVVTEEGIAPAERLLELEDELMFIKQTEDELKERYEAVKEEIFGLFDDMGAKGLSFRYTSPKTGKVLTRELTPIDPFQHPKIDIAKLQMLLTPEQWEIVTTSQPILDEKKLVDAIESDNIPNVLDDIISYPEQIAKLYHRDPKSEDDMEEKVSRMIKSVRSKNTKK